MSKVEAAIQQYWRISIAYEKRPEGDGTITTTSALRQLGKTLMEVNPERAVVRSIMTLQQSIITGGKPRCQTVTGSRSNNLTLIPRIKP